MKFLDPKNDLVIQKIFSTHPEYCLSLINSLLPRNGQVQLTSVVPTDWPGSVPVFKNPVLLLDGIDNQGTPCRIVFQMMWTDGFLQSVLLSKNIALIRNHEEFQDLKFDRKVYAIALVNDVFEHGSKLYYHHFDTVEDAQMRTEIPNLEFIFVELPKFSNRINEIKDKQMYWLSMFTEVKEGDHQIPDLLREDPQVSAAAELCREGVYSSAELLEYQNFLKQIQTRQGISSEAEERGFRRGVEKGMELGIEKGYTRGFEKGTLTQKKRMAMRAIQLGMNAEQVMELADLSELTINNLINLSGEYGMEAINHLGE